MTRATKRRWFQFCLAMILVVAVFACCFGYQVNWIRQRHTALAIGQVEIEEQQSDADPFASAPITVAAPSLLGLLGERGYSDLSFKCSNDDFVLTPAEKSEVKRLQQLFPEASIGFYWTPPPESASPAVSGSKVKSQDAPPKEYLKFPAESDYQMDSGIMGTERSGMSASP